ncbi:sec-independent protein translocase protein TatA [Seinonella peptonophila]|uniref:Sec-independent protein translocase protein TatA n=1 Tax=Seinonella peptonophila TaxID=112248 RepID=A0A1M4U575_9BACL|nr:twin-arginine translocase TatA/TatE family subunit [Seinonella peptonophila]SHE51697.1 sec-independent protein translocase protein TatA [Seinonella peptonophila]
MFANIGPIGFIVIIAVALLFWGPKKLPELGKATGETIRAFRQSISGKDHDSKEKTK